MTGAMAAAAAHRVRRLAHTIVRILREEAVHVRSDVRSVRPTVGFALALLCVVLVIVGNVILLIAINFWIATFPAVTVQHNSSQIALQTVVALLLLGFFASLHALFMCVTGVGASWRALVATDRLRAPSYRLLLLVVSGASQAGTNLLATYAMTYTPAFIQAILLCCVPFATQAWAVVFIREERRRNYVSVLFVLSLLCFVAGVLLAGVAAFVERDGQPRVSLAWAFVYLLSSVAFGLWCVSQRLYLDAVAPRRTHDNDEDNNNDNNDNDNNDNDNNDNEEDDNNDVTASSPPKRRWARQAEDDVAAKFVLLVATLVVQTMVTVLLFPVDALPWFGTSPSVAAAWRGLRQSFDFIFASWHNVRYGLFYSLGTAMSFVGCVYLSEHSPTLASVVMQLAGPITSIVLLLVPQWNLIRESSPMGYKVGGVVLLFCAALLYHFWEQRSVRLLTRLHASSHHHRHDTQTTRQEHDDDKARAAHMPCAPSAV